MSPMQPGMLPAVAEELGPVGVFIDDGEMIVDVAVLRPGAHLPAAEADGFDRVLRPSARQQTSR